MPVVLITGSGRGTGIGYAIAHAFAKENHTVVLHGRDQHSLTQVAQTLQAGFGNKILSVCADISDYNATSEMFMQIEKLCGPVDVLVNNAGVSHFGLFGDMSAGEISYVLANNLQAAIHASHLATPHMIRAKAGCIINISSIWGLLGASCEVVYSAAKAGIIGFTKALAKELGPSNIRVNAIACGAIETTMNERLSEEERAEFVSGVSLGRFGLPPEVGDLAVFLASGKAAYLTGQVIALDGGM